MSEAPSPPSLAPPHVWIMEALVDSPETDVVALGELLIQNPGFWSRSSIARERVAIRFLEEYLASWTSADGDGSPASPFPTGETSRMPALDESDVFQLDVDRSCEDVLHCFLRKLRFLGPRKTCRDAAFINAIRHFIKKKRSTLPKCFLEQLKDQKFSEKSSSPTKIIETKRLLSDNGNGGARLCQASKNHENNASSENMEKVNEFTANNSLTVPNTELTGNDVMGHLDISTPPPPPPPPVTNTVPEHNEVESHVQPQPNENAPHSDQEIVQDATSGEDEQPFDVDLENKIIASEKCKFIASQKDLNPDLMTTGGTQATQQDLCIKCDEGGQLLICTVSSCPIAVHENCLGSTANFSDTGEFVCPFCSYSRATAAYYDARKKFSLAKKVLSSFMGWGPSLKQETSKPSLSGQPSDLNKSVKDNSMKEKASRTNEPIKDGKQTNGSLDGCSNGVPAREEGFFNVSRTEDDSPVKQKANRSIESPKDGKRANSYIDGGRNGIPTREGLLDDNRNKDASPGVANHESECHFEQVTGCTRVFVFGRSSKTIRGHCNDKFVDDNQQATSSAYLSLSEHISQKRPGRASDVAKPPENEGGTKHGKESSNDEKRRKKDLPAHNKNQKKNLSGDHVDEIETSTEYQAETSNNCQYVSALEKTCETSSEVNSGKRKAATTGLQIHNQVKYSPSRKEKRSHASPRHFASSRFQLPLGRRNRLPWTKEEEEILKEAMQNVTHCGRHGGTPWADVLEYGKHVFNKTRQPADLRVKWRSIQKKEK